MVAYSNDWKEQLPNRVANVSWCGPGELWRFPRLPVIGFDTTTILPANEYHQNTSTACGNVCGPAGLAYVMRDYMKNDWDIMTCPDGWWTKDVIMQKCGDGIACGCWGPPRLTMDGGMVGYL